MGYGTPLFDRSSPDKSSVRYAPLLLFAVRFSLFTQSLLSPRSKRVMLIGLLLFTCSSAEPVLVTLPMVTHSVHPRRAVGVDCSCFVSPSPPRLARAWSSPREPQPSRNQPPSGSLYGCVGTGTQASRSHNNNKIKTNPSRHRPMHP